MVDFLHYAVIDVVRDEAGEEFGVAGRYETVEAMLDAEDLEAAVVATPAHLNASSALPCLTRGIDTLMEKPPGLSLEETHALKEAAGESRFKNREMELMELADKLISMLHMFISCKKSAVVKICKNTKNT